TIDHAACQPDAGHVVGDDDVSGVGELLRLGQVLDLREPPAGGEHEERVTGPAAGALGGDDVGLEDRAAVAGDVDEADRVRGCLGDGGEVEGASGDQGRRHGAHG